MDLSRVRGFTFFELIMVMVLVGVLAVAVVPRFFDSNAFLDKGFSDETVAILRYAQKAAVVQRRTVCATFGQASVTLTIAATAGGNCSINLVSPTGANPFTVTAKGGAKFSTTPAAINFSPLGQPLDAGGTLIAPPGRTITVVNKANATVAQITIEAETGYVH